MPPYRIITVGASAGGMEALRELAHALPADLPAAVFVTLHVPPYGMSALPRILCRAGPLPAAHAEDGEEVRPGRIRIAPPDQHLLIKRGLVRLARGPRENSARPAVDPMFRTAARAYGPRVIAVVLTGTLDDGTAGLRVVKRYGGTAVVQDPEDALYPGMPASAVASGCADHVLPLADIPACLVRLAHEEILPVRAEPIPPDPIPDIAEMIMNASQSEDPAGTPSGFACPECHGVLWEVDEDGQKGFRCRVGHAYSGQALLAGQAEALEAALWTALRALEENAALSRRMSLRMRERGNAARVVERFRQQAEDSEHRAALIRNVLLVDAPVRADVA